MKPQVTCGESLCVGLLRIVSCRVVCSIFAAHFYRNWNHCLRLSPKRPRVRSHRISTHCCTNHHPTNPYFVFVCSTFSFCVCTRICANTTIYYNFILDWTKQRKKKTFCRNTELYSFAKRKLNLLLATFWFGVFFLRQSVNLALQSKKKNLSLKSNIEARKYNDFL